MADDRLIIDLQGGWGQPGGKAGQNTDPATAFTNKGWTTAFDSLKKGITGKGDPVGGALTAGGDAIVGAASKALLATATPIGAAVAKGMEAGWELFKAIPDTMDKLNHTLQNVNGEAALGVAERQISVLEAQMRQGEALGESLADISRSSGRMDAALIKMQTDILRPLMPMIEKIYSVLADVYEIAAQITGYTSDILPHVANAAANTVPMGSIPKLLMDLVGIGAQIKENTTPERTGALQEETRKFLDPDHTLKQFHDSLQHESKKSTPPHPGMFNRDSPLFRTT